MASPLSTFHHASDSVSCRLEKKFILGGPVTCVSFLGSPDEYLSAKGPYIEVHRQGSVLRSLIFKDGGTIHGMRPFGDVWLLFGGRQVALIEPNSLEPMPLLAPGTGGTRVDLVISDWIWDARIQEQGISDRDRLVAFGLANNVCECWRLDTSESMWTAQRVQRITSQVRCITYCMAFCGWDNRHDDLVLASGTVFNEVLVWTPFIGVTKDSSIAREVEHRLIGHEGVILALAWASDETLLVSASDDRSVRLWILDQMQWNCLWIAWGHTARVWNVAFAPQHGVVSTGEDGTARLWDLVTGKEISKIHNYSSQSLWRVHTCQDMALLGTNSGCSLIWNLQSSQPSQEVGINMTGRSVQITIEVPDDRPNALQEDVNEDLPETLVETPLKNQVKRKKKSKVSQQVIFGMDFIQQPNGDHCLAVGTRCGSLLILDLNTMSWKDQDRWSERVDSTYTNDVKAADATCLSISQKRDVAVGTTTGTVLLWNLDTSNPVSIERELSVKSIQSVRWIDRELLVSFHIKGIVVLWKTYQGPLSISCMKILDTTTGSIPVSIGVISGVGEYVVGDSEGNLALFCDAAVQGNTMSSILFPTDICRRVHAKEHVNDILCQPGGRIVSVGNDGRCTETFVQNGALLVRGTSVQVTGLSSVTQVWVINGEKEEIILSGYYGNSFTVMNYTDGFELMRIETGGRQRQLKHCLFRTGSHRQMSSPYGVAICAIRKDGRNDLILKTNLSPFTTARPSATSKGIVLHGEPVYDCCLFVTKDSTNYSALLSGSEDCSVKLSFISNDDVKCSLQLPPQESCVRAVATSRRANSSVTLLVVGGGKLSIDMYMLEDRHEPHSEFSSDRIHVCQIGRGQIRGSADIDHRINAIRALPGKREMRSELSSAHLVFTGDSCGNLNLFSVKESHEGRRFLMPGDLLFTCERPVLCLDVVCWMHHCLLFTGTTDGNMSVWNLSFLNEESTKFSAISCLYTLAAHQMGTNSINTSVIGEVSGTLYLLVCSVGDDQALSAVSCSFTSDPAVETCSFHIREHSVKREADVSAMKGVQFVSKYRFVTTGYSQKLSLWEWSEGVGCHLVMDAVVDVSDVNCLTYCACDSRHLTVIGGDGVEIVELQCSDARNSEIR